MSEKRICLNCDFSTSVTNCNEKYYFCYEAIQAHRVDLNHSCSCFIERKIKGAYTSKVSLGENDFYAKKPNNE